MQLSLFADESVRCCMTIRFIGYVSYPCKQMFCVHGQRCMILLMVKPCQWTSLYVALELNWQQPKSTAGQWRGCFNPLIILAVSRAERRRNCRAFPADARKMLTHWIRQCIFAQITSWDEGGSLLLLHFFFRGKAETCPTHAETIHLRWVLWYLSF